MPVSRLAGIAITAPVACVGHAGAATHAPISLTMPTIAGPAAGTVGRRLAPTSELRASMAYVFTSVWRARLPVAGHAPIWARIPATAAPAGMRAVDQPRIATREPAPCARRAVRTAVPAPAATWPGTMPIVERAELCVPGIPPAWPVSAKRFQIALRTTRITPTANGDLLPPETLTR